jgi:hypothetical protein
VLTRRKITGEIRKESKEKRRDSRPGNCRLRRDAAIETAVSTKYAENTRCCIGDHGFRFVQRGSAPAKVILGRIRHILARLTTIRHVSGKRAGISPNINEALSD